MGSAQWAWAVEDPTAATVPDTVVVVVVVVDMGVGAVAETGPMIQGATDTAAGTAVRTVRAGRTAAWAAAADTDRIVVGGVAVAAFADASAA